MKIIEAKTTKNEFFAHVNIQIEEFSEHVSRIRKHCQEMKRLKENIPSDHCIVHMDSAENYSCKTVQEIQSAYWNQTSVTLHQTVIYHKKTGSEELLHKCIIVVSYEMSHNAATVLTIIDQLIPEVKLLNQDTTCINYWTESPTSQYRNKVIFNTIANHDILFGVKAK